MENKKRGGFRPGAGRPTMAKKEVSLHVKVSKKEADALAFYSKNVGLNKSDIVNLLLHGLNDYIIFCSECQAPIVYKPSYLFPDAVRGGKCPKCGAIIK